MHADPQSEGDPAAGPEPIPEALAFFETIDIDVTFGGERACYIPSLDRIHMPELARFESAGLLLSTWCHELAHNAAFWIMPRGQCKGLICHRWPRGEAA